MINVAEQHHEFFLRLQEGKMTRQLLDSANSKIYSFDAALAPPRKVMWLDTAPAP
jgi:hypothetical protein